MQSPVRFPNGEFFANALWADADFAAWVPESGLTITTGGQISPVRGHSVTLTDANASFGAVNATAITIDANTLNYCVAVFVKKQETATAGISFRVLLNGASAGDRFFNAQTGAWSGSGGQAGELKVIDYSTDWWLVYRPLANNLSTTLGLRIIPAYVATTLTGINAALQGSVTMSSPIFCKGNTPW